MTREPARPAQESPHPRLELLQAEWLGEVVVGPQVQAPHLVHVRVPPREQHHRDLVAGGADPPQQLPAREVRQDDVEDHQIRQTIGHHAQCIGGARGRFYLETMLGQREAVERKEVLVAVDDQHRYTSETCSPTDCATFSISLCLLDFRPTRRI